MPCHHPVQSEETKPVRIRLVLNAAGGTLKGADVDGECSAIARRFALHGVDADLVPVQGGDLEAEVRAGLEASGSDRYDAVVVGGGDGSISAAANALAGTDMPLGILPLGTLNHFAKDLGLPLDIDAAVAAIAAGRTQAVDVAEVSGRVFVNNSSIGVYPYMVVERDRQQSRHGLAKWPAMVLALLRALRRFPRRRLTVAAEGEGPRQYRTACVFVGNNTYEIDLLNLGERSTLNGGGLCLYVVRHRTPWGLLGLALRSLLGRLDQLRDFEMRTGLATVLIRSHAHRLPVSVDGEVIGLETPLRYRIRPGDLRVFVPETKE
jgi:diacylglycerol kinase family enzyme